MQDGTANQAPAEAPAQKETPSVDYAAIEAELKEALGDGVSLSNIAERAREMRKTMGSSQEEAAELRKKLQSVEPLVPFARYLQNDEKFANHIRTSVDSYFNPETGEREYADPDERREIPKEVRQGTDPTTMALHEIKTRMDAIDQRNQMADLKREFPEDVTPEMERSIYERMSQMGGNPRENFIYLKGQEMVTRKPSRSEGMSVGGRVQAGGVNPDVSPQHSVAEMNESEHDSYALDRIAQITGTR